MKTNYQDTNRWDPVSLVSVHAINKPSAFLTEHSICLIIGIMNLGTTWMKSRESQ